MAEDSVFNEIAGLSPREDFFIDLDNLSKTDVIVEPVENDNVQIYKDPFSKTRLEGSAVVKKVLMSDGQRDLCLVQMDDDGRVVERWIKKEIST